MSEILYTWLNNEVKLNLDIENIEKELSTGYLFAELLEKYKLIPTLSKYYNSDNHKHKVHNFTLLDQPFRNMGIILSPEDYKNLIEGNRKLAKLILYKIKMYLSKKEINFDNLMFKNSNLMNDLYKKMNYPKIASKAHVENIHGNKAKGIKLLPQSIKDKDPDGYLEKIEDLRRKELNNKFSMSELPDINSHRIPKSSKESK